MILKSLQQISGNGIKEISLVYDMSELLILNKEKQNIVTKLSWYRKKYSNSKDEGISALYKQSKILIVKITKTNL